MFSCYNFVLSKNPNTGREAADFATEFSQTRSLAKRYSYCRNGAHSNTVGQHSQASSQKGLTNEDGHKHPNSEQACVGTVTQAGLLTIMENNRFGLPTNYAYYQRLLNNTHIRPNFPNRVKRVSSPVLIDSDKKSFLVKGFVGE